MHLISASALAGERALTTGEAARSECTHHHRIDAEGKGREGIPATDEPYDESPPSAGTAAAVMRARPGLPGSIAERRAL
jgi:hypothetical protein